MRAFRTLLTALFDLVLPPSADAQLVRDASSEVLRAHYAPQEARGAVALLPFRTPLVRALIHEAKFRRNEQAIELLAKLLAHHINTHGCATLIPIPLAPARHRERGYNQVALIAQHTAQRLPSLTVRSDLLSRVRHTPPQTSLTRAERLTNLSNAFAAKTAGLPVDTPLLLFDDVTTTGATLATAAAALREAGFIHVKCLALAH